MNFIAVATKFKFRSGDFVIRPTSLRPRHTCSRWILSANSGFRFKIFLTSINHFRTTAHGKKWIITTKSASLLLTLIRVFSRICRDAAKNQKKITHKIRIYLLINIQPQTPTGGGRIAEDRSSSVYLYMRSSRHKIKLVLNFRLAGIIRERREKQALCSRILFLLHFHKSHASYHHQYFFFTHIV